MLKKFVRNMSLLGLSVLKYTLYVVIAIFLVIFIMFGLYFIVTAFLWIVLVCVAFLSAILIFIANFFMFFVALFDASLWVTMGNMWNWLWGWFANGNITLWPHLLKPFLPYLISGVVLLQFYEVIKLLNVQIEKVKKIPGK